MITFYTSIETDVVFEQLVESPNNMVERCTVQMVINSASLNGDLVVLYVITRNGTVGVLFVEKRNVRSISDRANDRQVILQFAQRTEDIEAKRSSVGTCRDDNCVQQRGLQGSTQSYGCRQRFGRCIYSQHPKSVSHFEPRTTTKNCWASDKQLRVNIIRINSDISFLFFLYVYNNIFMLIVF